MLENATARILQSKYFTPSFNTAIFDGPLRVYFAQQQEPEALKVYFSLQSYFFKEESQNNLREFLPKDMTLFVMIYPNKELFQQSFDQECDFAYQSIVHDMGQDYVIGVQGPISDKLKDDIMAHIQSKLIKKPILEAVL